MAFNTSHLEAVFDAAQKAEQAVENGERVGRAAGKEEVHGNVGGDAARADG